MKPFHLKQFSIEQDSCAMKVTLDACLFGALCDVKNSQRILDIGTGTGLLALMSAQGSTAKVDALELDEKACEQAQQNIINSQFSKRIQVIHQDIKQFSCAAPYDTIICNPPFFSDHLKGPNAKRNQARHNDRLSFDDLCISMSKHLSKDGKAWVLLPCHEMAAFKISAHAQQLYVSQGWQIKSKPDKAAHRYVFSLEHSELNGTHKDKAIDDMEKIIIQSNDSGEYSAQFKSLLADYYLKL